eukprot:SAG22_NODE_878_length_6715_cov_9.368652_12_plen_50_part_00
MREYDRCGGAWTIASPARTSLQPNIQFGWACAHRANRQYEGTIRALASP